MAPISSGSSTWTSSGIHFSIVSMATGMGPSSSGSQATVASVVTSTLLAGLGVSGGVISSLPSSVGTTQAPRATQSPARPTAPLAKPSTEQAAAAAATTPQDADAQAEDTQATREGEGSEGEEEEKDKDKEEDGEGEQDESESEKKTKSKAARGGAMGQSNGTAADEPTAPTPASTAKQKGGGTPTAAAATPAITTTATASTDPDEQLVRDQTHHTEVVGEPTTPQPHNNSAEMQIPQSSTLAPKISGEDHKLWPFSVHTGELWKL